MWDDIRVHESAGILPLLAARTGWGPDGGTSWTMCRLTRSVELSFDDPTRKISAKTTHQVQQPRSTAGVHDRIGRHHTSQTADESNGDIGVFGRTVTVEVAFQVDQKLTKRL